MGTPQTPELLESPQEPILPTPEPIIGPTDAEKLEASERRAALALDALRSVNERLNRQEQELIEARKPEARPRNVEAERDQFFADPIDNNRRIIAEELDRRMAPFQKFITKIESDSLVDNLINQARNNPAVAAKWDQPLENYIRANVGSLNPLNESSFNTLLMAAFGAQNLGLLPGQSSSSTPSRPSNMDNRVTPPNIPPSRSAPIPSSNQNKRRQLTEEELRVAREFRMTPEEYLDFLEADRRSVAVSEIGKAPAKPSNNGAK